MAYIPLREFSKLGVITDVDPCDLPLTAWSYAANCRFGAAQQITRGPIFREHGACASEPRHILAYSDPNGSQHILVAKADGSLAEWASGGTETDLTPASWTPAVSEAITTTTRLNGVFYVNREDHVPWYRNATGSGDFALLSSYNSGNGFDQFPSTTRFKALRSVASVLVGINPTQGATNYPQKVCWSDFADYGVPPRDWDIGEPSSSAGENILGDMKGQLLDGLALGNRLILYGSHEVWDMSYTGTSSMFNFTKMPMSEGILTTNGACEVSGLHYVFGTESLWRHDGQTRSDISTGLVKKFVFDNLIRDYAARAFVFYNQRLSEVMFCYPSDDAHCAFPLGAPWNNVGCNRAAAFNTITSTWQFYDLPYVSSADFASVATGLTFADLSTSTFDELAGSFSSFGGSETDALLFTCAGYTHPITGATVGPKVRSYELYASVAVSNEADVQANAPMVIEKVMIDLDELKANLTTYKLCSSIVVQGRFSPGTTMTFQLGACDHPNAEPVYTEAQTYDDDNMKLDFDIAGRFLAIKIAGADYGAYTLSGIDFDLISLGN